MSVENNGDLIADLVNKVETAEQAHKVFEALSEKFDLLLTVQPAGAVNGVELTVADAEQALQEAVDNHEDPGLRGAVHDLWAGIVEGLLDSPAITEQDGSLIAQNYDTVEALVDDYLKLLTTGPWRPLLGLAPENQDPFGYFHSEYASLVDAYRSCAPLVGGTAWDVVETDQVSNIVDPGTPVVVESYNLFRIDPRTDEVAVRVVP